ncbi:MULTISPECIES: histidine triad nucleotide-binding protein [Bordetella]|uniref:Histidine triad nucleotide-binding protein n=1 Tax=Bordetella genomosp. 6 TaxID=463024 RepID=A0ABX4FDD6_9BORD|nr:MULTISPECIES: histidine triad nucleotide-binding protein [Bordetella]AOB28931.1 histidine triad nucleotide-binding protein [Bordetella bronchiseptica]AZW46288.1 histidine triad nucleotide-binding protein [Bordetella bronchiseptica]KCV59157.1 scavenger mRNA decapping enzyme [Bordetella bronchiseptica 99-R-0433]MBN3267185.1 histidine triad nucleotide-binding protein [Bordetella bronchiseptica]OZI80226.1 histidine triad nucleotide-binding protein [Bordetella genomosp. 6]
MSDNCIFCKIARGEIPAKKVFEDDEFIAFHDINPAAPVHLLLIPRRHVVSLQDIAEDDAGWLGRMTVLASRLAAGNGCNPGPDGGFRLMANSGAEGGQEVPHLHFHILGGPRPWKGRVAPAA